MIRRFDSIAALADQFKQLGCEMTHSSADSWYGNESAQDTLRLAYSGDTRLVAEAEKLLDQLETRIEVPKRVWERSPVGPICVAPDVLAGIPTPMRRIREVSDEHQPIAIFACSTISAGISTSTIRKRGTTILALILALSRVRPISLHTVATTGAERGDRLETVLCTRIETAPLHLASACWALTSAGFARRLNYDFARAVNGFSGGWPELYNRMGEDKYCEHLGEALSHTTKDRTLVIKPTHLHDPLADNPIPWLNTQIEHFLGKEEADD